MTDHLRRLRQRALNIRRLARIARRTGTISARHEARLRRQARGINEVEAMLSERRFTATLRDREDEIQ